MKRKFKAIISAALLGILLGAQSAPCVNAADNSFSVDISGIDVNTSSGVTLYPNNTERERVIQTSEYGGFRNSGVLVFDKNGKLIEAGANLMANEDGTYGSPQLTVKIPAGGFMVAFGSNTQLNACYNVAMEGAMLYNATMSVIYPVKATVSGSKLTVEYDNPAPAPADAKKFMFVGNSTTYFNGTPIKFKALAKAVGVNVDVEYCTFGSAYLSEFADPNHERGKAFRSKLANEKFDYVVFQDAAGAGYTGTHASFEAMLPLVEKNGAQPLLYMRYGTSVESNGRHHHNYATLAEKHGIPCAPISDAYVIAWDEAPSINLFADDGGHHSKEGSYLIACCWLQSYLGIDPRGNSYTAELPEDVAKTLQNIAYKACTEGYEYPEAGFSFFENGVKYENLALNKPYTSNGKVYNNANWTDTGSDGKPLGKLTDGRLAIDGKDGAIGAYIGSDVSITVDLGELCSVKALKTELYGNDSWGITNPKDSTVSVSVSDDGENFTDAGEAVGEAVTESEDWSHRNFNLTLNKAVNARYVKVTFKSKGNFCWNSEIAVFGTSGTAAAPDASEDISTTDISEDISTDSFQEPANKSLKWLYITIAALAVIAVGVAIFLISRKK